MDRLPQVIVGVDTHRDLHVVAVIDGVGRLLGSDSFPVSMRGYERLVRFAERFGRIERVGVEGTGAYGAGLVRFLSRCGYPMIEVDRPDRKSRRRKGKSDVLDAEAAARAALSGAACGTPKTRDGHVEMIRSLRVARRSAIRARTQAMNQIRSLVVSAPQELRSRLEQLPAPRLLRSLLKLQPGELDTPSAATKMALRELARRHRYLSAQIERLDRSLDRLVATAAPSLLALTGVGTDVAGQLLVTVGDNPDRLRSEASFAHLCGVAPLSASSGKTHRHRLNRGGDRGANNALWRIVMVRLHCDERTKRYMATRQQQGRTKAEVIRCLKRYVAREVYRSLVDDR